MSENFFGFSARARAICDRLRPGRDRFRIGGTFTIECVAPDGTTRWTTTAKNGVVNVALNNLLDVYLRAQTTPTAWYMGLIDNAGYTALAAADTMASHGGWAEVTAYSETTRPQWSAAAASGQSVVNATTVDFSINASKTVRGLFLITDSAKSGTTGTLFATAAFSGGNQTVNNGDTLKVTYTVSAASG
jgi:hypothetical protein